ncbi:MAG: hypothetical protein A2445_03460 [Candidatus Jacksonbacteria bacterium RIFOXYC2_FULL_44_29]|nr:MAG: Band 7 protein [Parcubacteria group bacterium GW2011_GWA2_42_28]OGY77763.1 MAG: hypothetical protein A2295_03115 [Candidatus Jacksonbacteria bacterium RIFOXYB2_FULL_44_15]OGY78278.1 MAG: hypothetical protein A2445_03460 [Candidatus Jacksonbacteria bacterium RIFOXYC2_FULL_44_29]OGY78899.1 MAG: hypothetical protein A2550_05175 [Candidatus Jacksonbacteria bacterium RIFOXYD2_FULL_43_21]HCC49619.1 band 7 protein [Candidatus Jacksonbacteria bacterium]
MQQNYQKIIRIIFFIILGIIILKGLNKILPLLILAGLFVFVWFTIKNRKLPLKQQASNLKSMFDPSKVNIKTPSAQQFKLIIGGLITIGLIITILATTITVVPAGHVGVMDFFGKVSARELPPGLSFKIPLSRVIKFSTQTQDYTMTVRHDEGQVQGDDSIAALTKEGLKVNLDITVLYHLEKNQAAKIYQNVGSDFEEKIIRSSIRSSIREVVAQYTAEALYSEKRKESADNLLALLKQKIEPRGILIEDVLLRDVTLPAKLSDAIEEKLKADQEAQRFDFVLQKEVKEAERKRIEAAGQRDAQKIINESLTDQYLQYLYIRELKDRAGTIYVPVSPENGLPLFKGL